MQYWSHHIIHGGLEEIADGHRLFLDKKLTVFVGDVV